MTRPLINAAFTACLVVTQGCNVQSVADRVSALDNGPHGPNAATGGVNYRIDGQPDSAVMDEQVTACRRNGQQWTFLAGKRPVLTLNADNDAQRVIVHAKEGDVAFLKAECSPVHLDVNASSGSGKVTLTCDKATKHVGAGIRFADCRD